MITNLIIVSAVGVLLFISGLFISKGKFLNLIAGYNTLSPAKKAKVNKETLGKSVGFFLIIISILTILFGLILFFFPVYTTASTIIYSVVICSLAIVLSVKINKKC